MAKRAEEEQTEALEEMKKKEGGEKKKLFFFVLKDGVGGYLQKTEEESEARAQFCLNSSAGHWVSEDQASACKTLLHLV